MLQLVDLLARLCIEGLSMNARIEETVEPCLKSMLLC